MSTIETVPDLLRRAARKAPDRVGVEVDGGESITYGEWLRRSLRLAQGLMAAGIGRGDRVALAFGNERAPDFGISYFGVHLAGGVNVPLNMRLAEAERGKILAHAEPKLVLGVGGKEPGNLERDGDEAALPQLRGDDLADILYTSGTTGEAKGVAAPHANVVTLGRGGFEAFSGHVFLHAIPLFTFAGAHGMQLMPMGGLMTSLVMPKFDVARYLELIETRRPSVSYLVPAMAVLVLDEPDIAQRNLSSLRVLMHGAAPMPPEASRRLAHLLPHAWIANVYGMTEAGGVGCILPPGEAERRAGSVGKPIGNTQIQILSDKGEPLPVDEIGEVAVRSDAPPRRYFRNDEATDATWRSGWLVTGDLGYLDADGYLYLVDRKKDLIIRGGHNIYAGEVDAVLSAHPAVREAATVGVTHRVLGEDVASFVVLRVGASASAQEIQEFARERLADYKVPRRIIVATDLPRNALGKVLKRELRKQAEAVTN